MRQSVKQSADGLLVRERRRPTAARRLPVAGWSPNSGRPEGLTMLIGIS